MSTERDGPARYEADDASVTQVALSAFALLAGTFLVLLLMWGLFNALKRNESWRHTLSPLAGPQQLPPEPRLQVQPWVDLENLRRHEDDVMRTYGWADRASGKARIPLNQAMDLVLERGLPTRGGGNASRR